VIKIEVVVVAVLNALVEHFCAVTLSRDEVLNHVRLADSCNGTHGHWL
jgi:hypothetical protein